MASTYLRPRLMAIVGIIGPLVFTATTVSVALLNPTEDFFGRTVSQLATGVAGWLVTGAFILVALTLLAFTTALRKTHSPQPQLDTAVLLLHAIALCFVLMAIISHSGATWITHEHYTLMTLAGALIVLTGALLTVFRGRKTPG